MEITQVNVGGLRNLAVYSSSDDALLKLTLPYKSERVGTSNAFFEERYSSTDSMKQSYGFRSPNTELSYKN